MEDAATGRTHRAAMPDAPARRTRRAARLFVLLAGACAFLFPFYYMVLGSLQAEPRADMSAVLPGMTDLTLGNYTAINERIPLVAALINSGIFTGGVILCTVVFGLMAGYALARIRFRGQGAIFHLVLLVQLVPFHLLMIPLYVLIVRSYGLADSYLGVILPYTVNSTAVFVFRQFFLQLPRELFEAARVDGAGELTTMLRIAVPLCKPALLTTVLLTFIGPWNEFLWPFLVTKDPDMQPLAVALANYVSNVAGRAANPYGAILAGACVLAAPAVALFLVFQRRFLSTNLGSGVKG